MDRQVAIKVPTAWLVATERAKEEFLREARSVSRLQHEGIVQAYDFGQEADGRCYLVYEYVEGASLAERIKPERLAADPLPPEEASKIVAQVAEALHYAHLQGMFHRDIKPANILLGRQGRAKVADFGLAVREDDLARERGRLAGTLQYMSPEQLRREGHHLDGRSDIYSLGVVLYELLCGRRTFTAATKDELADQILHREARPPRQIMDAIPRELERICLKAISKRVDHRYSTASDMAEELWRFVKSPGEGVPRPTASAGQGGSSAATLDRGVPVVKYYLYVSDSKVQMLFPQIPRGVVSQLAEELQIDIQQWGSGRDQLPEEATRFAKAAIVKRFIEQNASVGSIDEPAEYFRGMLDVRWGELGHGLVYFGGETAKTIFGLGGSVHHMIGASGRSAISRSPIRALLSALRMSIGWPDGLDGEDYWLKFGIDGRDEGERALHAVVRATTEMEGPKQRLDFLAKRLFHAAGCESRNVLLGTPIYVALAE
jgi:serine/threonine protein kinase